MQRRLLVLDPDFAFIAALHRSHADLHDRFELIRRHFVHAFTAGHTLRHDFGIEQNFPNPLSGCIQGVVAFYYQADLPPDYALRATSLTAKHAKTITFNALKNNLLQRV
jgi:hypothetical protein